MDYNKSIEYRLSKLEYRTALLLGENAVIITLVVIAFLKLFLM